MYAGKLVFAQVMECAPWHTFRRLVPKYQVTYPLTTTMLSVRSARAPCAAILTLATLTSTSSLTIRSNCIGHARG